MNESTNSENNSVVLEKPVHLQALAQSMDEEIKFPPFPEPEDCDFDDDITEEEREYYKNKFKDLNTVVNAKLHCSACDRHLGCSAQTVMRMRSHPMLRTLMCHTCHTFYNSGEFEKGDDGSELYCRWCGQGGQVYCCSNCPHVFCAKCIKRNLGMPMIKQIEETDDWKCFKCNSKHLWDLRAICWAVFRYCDLKNKITFNTQDPIKKTALQRECDIDHSECCKNKGRRKEKNEDKKPKLKEDSKKNLNNSGTKPTSTIQVKKFASMTVEDQSMKNEKKVAQKRSISPSSRHKPIFIKNPMTQAPKILTPVMLPPMSKKTKIPGLQVNPMSFGNDRKQVNNTTTYTRIRPKPMPIMYNGLNTNHLYTTLVSDNINLSIDSLTQGLDMASVVGLGNNIANDDVVCTPDFPLEPLCEVVEDNNDDDVQCIGPLVAPKQPPPLIPRNLNASLPNIDHNSLATENIIQMTENDVTVNAATGGLKFRVDPQTLSSNKMYRLPDGRIFAINANPNMPGGYSATIVAVTDDISKMQSKGATYAAKLSSVRTPSLTPPPLKSYRTSDGNRKSKRSTPKSSKVNKRIEKPSRECDLNVPVEWYRYNLIDAVDALEYSLQRLNKLKQEATTAHLRTRTISEMKNLHKRLDRVLTTSTSRFKEIRDNLNKEWSQYISKKLSCNVSEDDDVEILHDDNDDPIFIDENSVDSNANESQDIDLTAVGSSDHNDSNEKSPDKNEGVYILNTINDSEEANICILPDSVIGGIGVGDTEKQSIDSIDLDPKTYGGQESATIIKLKNKESCQDQHDQDSADVIEFKEKGTNEHKQDGTDTIEVTDKDLSNDHIDEKLSSTSLSANRTERKDKGVDVSTEIKNQLLNEVDSTMDEEILKDVNSDPSVADKKTDDQEMSEEMIANLLNDDGEDSLKVDKGIDTPIIDKEKVTAMDISG